MLFFLSISGIFVGVIAATLASLVGYFGMYGRRGFVERLFGLTLFGRRRRVWGTVFDVGTSQPLTGVGVALIDDVGRVVEQVVTDRFGRYGFLAGEGKMCRISVEDRRFTAIFSSASHGVYGRLYTGGIVTVADGESVRQSIAVVTNENVVVPLSFWRRFFFSVLPVIAQGLRWGLRGFFIVGGLCALWQLALSFSFIHATIVLAYVVIVLFGAFATVFAPVSGVVVDRLRGVPVGFAMLSLCDRSGCRRACAVSNGQGRFVLFVEDGIYTLYVRGRRSDGTPFAISVRRIVYRGVLVGKVAV